MFAVSVAVFAVSAVIIAVAGTHLVRSADRLADTTGLGQAFTGALLLGATTSLPGITVSVAAAAGNHPILSVSNAFGGIVAQTVFLAVADITYRRVNLEHAAASVPNMMCGALLMVLLAIALIAMVGPDVSMAGVHVATPGMLLVYGLGMWHIRKAHDHPMWIPRYTPATQVEVRQPTTITASRFTMLPTFLIAAVFVMTAGYAVTMTSRTIFEYVGLTESLMGGVVVAIITSLPELVTAVIAVRQGALALAIGGVLGGNAFDTLFVAAADIAYRDGSIYHAVSTREYLLVALGVLMTATVLLGLLVRERRGLANIGFESASIIAAYIVGVILLAL